MQRLSTLFSINHLCSCPTPTRRVWMTGDTIEKTGMSPESMARRKKDADVGASCAKGRAGDLHCMASTPS